MINTVEELNETISWPEDPYVVPDDTPPPYARGDRVWVELNLVDGRTTTELPGVIDECIRPSRARRFVCSAWIGGVGSVGLLIPRLYCWENGVGESIKPRGIS